MPLSEIDTIGGINVTAAGTVEVRQDTSILRDGVPINGPLYRRRVLAADADLTNEDPRVALIASAARIPVSAIPQALALLAPLVPKTVQSLGV